MITLVPVSSELIEDSATSIGRFVTQALADAVLRNYHWLIFGEEWGRETQRLEVGKRAALWRDQTIWDDEECCA